MLPKIILFLFSSLCLLILVRINYSLRIINGSLMNWNRVSETELLNSLRFPSLLVIYWPSFTLLYLFTIVYQHSRHLCSIIEVCFWMLWVFFGYVCMLSELLLSKVWCEFAYSSRLVFLSCIIWWNITTMLKLMETVERTVFPTAESKVSEVTYSGYMLLKSLICVSGYIWIFWQLEFQLEFEFCLWDFWEFYNLLLENR